ncbi:unnamed protein product, partial [marine sediment metagenome]
GIICATQYLAKEIKKFNTNTHVAPNCINKIQWNVKNNKISKELDIFRLGYVGAAGHDNDLKLIYKSVLKILKENHDIRFIVRSGGFKPTWFKDHPQIDFKCVGWALSEYPQKIKDLNIDLAVAPIRDTTFNRCKSNLKWIEWSSMGVPLLASDVEPYKNTKGTIFLTSNDEFQWYKNINNTIFRSSIIT